MGLRVLSVRSGAALAAVVSLVVGVVVVPLAGALPARGSRAAARASVTLPPGLVTLEQRMEQLQVGSERFSMKIEIGGSGITGKGGLVESTKSSRGKGHRKASGGKGHGKAQITLGVRRGAAGGSPKMIPLLAGTGERSVSGEPGATETAVWKAKLLGAVPMEARLLGGRGYQHTPGIGRIDGGRPWVRTSKAELSEQDDSFAAPTGPGEGANGGIFAQLPKELGLASEVSEVGEATVDGEQTIEFAAKLNMGKLLENLTVHEPKAVRSELGGAKARIDVFFEPDGMPLKTSVTIHAKAISMSVVVDVLAVNVPVEVSAPPPGETISAAKLRALEKRKLATDLKRLKHRKVGALRRPT